MWVLNSTTARRESSTTLKQSIAKLHGTNNADISRLTAQPLFVANPEAALPLLSMIGHVQLSIDNLQGQLSRHARE
mgnify:FL=1